MKKIYLQLITKLVFLLIFCVSFLSCRKDETYNPEQKIQRIYEIGYVGPKYLIQEWTWDNDRLMKIDYYRDISLYLTEHYTYEKNKLVKVEDDDGYYKISYTHLKYKKIEYYQDGRLIATWDFSYLNNKVSKIIFSYENNHFFVNQMINGRFLSSLMSKEVISTLENFDKGSKSDFQTTITIKYKYTGGNIREMKLAFDDQDHSVTIFYKSYDKEQNPFYKHIEFTNNPFTNLLNVASSKNNPIDVFLLIELPPRISGQEKFYQEKTYKYSYKYDNNFPVEEEQTENDMYRYKRYYEYE